MNNHFSVQKFYQTFTSMSSCDLMYFREVGWLRRKERIRVTDSLILDVWEHGEGEEEEGKDRRVQGGGGGGEGGELG